MTGHLRGEVTPGVQKQYLLSIMTLAVMETKKEEFYIPKEAIWSEIIRSGNDMGKRLNLAFDMLEKGNDTLQNVFSNIPFTKVNDSTLYKLALQINDLPLEKYSGEIANRVISKLAEHEGRKGGNYLSPASISKVIVKLLDIKDGSSVFDPTSGTGQFLNQATDYAENLSLYGQEINYETWTISKMIAILQGNEDVDIRLGDTIRNPKFIEDDGLKEFDYVIMDPPYGLNNWGYEEADNDLYGRFSNGKPPRSSGDMAFILHALASLNEKGKAAIIVPHGVLFRGAVEGRIRRNLIEQDVIEAVIGLPSGLLYSSSIAVAILILNKNKQEHRKNGIFFINAEEESEQFRTVKKLGESHIKKITETYKANKEINRFSKWVSLKNIKDYALSLQTYFKEDRIDSLIGKVQVNEEIYDEMDTVLLKDVSNIVRGMNTPPPRQMEDVEATHLMVELSNVQDGQIFIDDLTPIAVKDDINTERYELKEGDIILSSRGKAIKIAVVPKTNKQPLLLSNHFLRIRPNPNINPYFLKGFLESPIGMFYLINSQKGSTVTVLTAKDIQDIPVPNLQYNLQEEIAEGFIQSKAAYIKRMQKAEEIHHQEYAQLYNEMGLKSTYEKMD